MTPSFTCGSVLLSQNSHLSHHSTFGKRTRRHETESNTAPQAPTGIQGTRAPSAVRVPAQRVGSAPPLIWPRGDKRPRQTPKQCSGTVLPSLQRSFNHNVQYKRFEKSSLKTKIVLSKIDGKRRKGLTNVNGYE